MMFQPDALEGGEGPEVVGSRVRHRGCDLSGPRSRAAITYDETDGGARRHNAFH